MSATLDALPALSAEQRLARSRAAISGWLADDEAERSAPGASGGLPDWLAGLRRHPLAAVAIDALMARWRGHKLVTSMRVAEAAAAETVAPLVRRHPVVLLGASALAGALLIRARPWRWLLRPALLGGIGSQIAAQLLDRLAAQPKVRQPTDRRPPAS